MALQACHECGTQISSEAKTCPSCGVIPKNKSNTVSQVVGVVCIIGFAWFYFGGGLEKQAAKEMSNIEAQVARDAVKQYNIAKAAGAPIDICVQAGLVSASYLQAKDDTNYAKWKDIEAADCSAAGVPR
ncbi:hypothetical protein GJ698_06500 [Pseudoduganella sp. FT26W]|uniref:Zinc-ribbon domain-containing protein n=1 Tax=Duganella aquatilis TaxID=2666082 RepID=A0A844CTR8_9BURK|nr:zinc-ribbon domain-containing protein [Duganella aquatilis]MRW83743.1 hypothetical protein [Duganella aquatilis]